MSAFLQSEEDLKWLADTKHISIEGVYSAILYGTEDCPDKIECYYGIALSSFKRTYIYDEKTETYKE